MVFIYKLGESSQCFLVYCWVNDKVHLRGVTMEISEPLFWHQLKYSGAFLQLRDAAISSLDTCTLPNLERFSLTS